MQTIKTRADIASDGRLRLDVPTLASPGEHDVVIMLDPKSEPAPGAWRELVGRLQWRGDAVAEQRRLRDEW